MSFYGMALLAIICITSVTPMPMITGGMDGARAPGPAKPDIPSLEEQTVALNRVERNIAQWMSGRLHYRKQRRNHPIRHAHRHAHKYAEVARA